MKTKNLLNVAYVISDRVETYPSTICQIKNVTGYLSINKHKRKQYD